MSETELLHKIAIKLNANCLSDLHIITKNQLQASLENFDVAEYSIKDWNYALSYILGVEAHLSNVSEIAGFFETFIEDETEM